MPARLQSETASVFREWEGALFDRYGRKALVAILILAIGLWLAFSYRTKAQVQDPVPGELVEALAANFGIQAVVEPSGTVLDNPELFAAMFGTDQAFVVSWGGNTQIFTPGLLFELKAIDPRWMPEHWAPNAGRLFQEQVLHGTAEGWRLYQVEFEQFRSVVAANGHGQYAGILTELSRIIVNEPKASNEPPHYVSSCSDWRLLTKNFFGQPAEALRACMAMHCAAQGASNCSLTGIPTSHGFFAKIQTSPDTPADALFAGQQCNSEFGYEVSYFMGNIELKFFNVAFGSAISGQYGAELTCGGRITLTER